MEENEANQQVSLKIVVCLFLTCNSILSFAETQDEILVTAKHDIKAEQSLISAEVLNQEDIIASGARNIAELLDDVAGISITTSGSRGSVSGVFIRGASLSQSIVLIDGVRVGSASLGQASIDSYPIDAIERVEIVRGPLSGIYGADAVGGVIHLFTKRQHQDSGSVTVSLGSDSSNDVSLSLGHGDSDNGIVIGAQRERSDGFDSTSLLINGNDDRDAFAEDSFSFAANWKPRESTKLMLSVLDATNEADFDNSFGNGEGVFTRTEIFTAALNLEQGINDRIVWTSTLGSNSDLSITQIFASRVKSQRDSASSEVSWQLSDASSLIIGADYYDEEIISDTPLPITQRDNKAAFALLHSQFDKLDIIANIRFDDNSAYGSKSNFNLAIGGSVGESWRWSASYGTAFAAPSFNFLYFPQFGNPDLIPEESNSLEFSLQGSTNIGDLRFSLFDTKVENLFSFDPTTFLAANISEAALRGVELGWKHEFDQWGLEATYDYLSARDQGTQLRLDDRPRHNFNFELSHQFDSATARFEFHAENGRYDNSGTRLASFGIVHFALDYLINDRMTVSARVNNLTNKDYVLNLFGFDQIYNTPDRKFQASLRYQF